MVSNLFEIPIEGSDEEALFQLSLRQLPVEVLESLPREQRLRLPMRDGSRSLNLSNAAAVVIYEAWRQLDFEGAV